MSTMAMASKNFPKAKMFETIEKYSLDVGCSQGIEFSTCSLGTLNDYFEIGLKVFSDLILRPSFDQVDVELVKKRMLASLREVPTDPNGYSNEVVNRVFYPKGHPYRHDHDEGITELEKLDTSELKKFHKDLLNSHNMKLIVVSSLKDKKLKSSLNRAFGSVKKSHGFISKVSSPKFDEAKAFEFEHRNIPTAYIKAKFVLPPVDSKDSDE